MSEDKETKTTTTTATTPGTVVETSRVEQPKTETTPDPEWGWTTVERKDETTTKVERE